MKKILAPALALALLGTVGYGITRLALLEDVAAAYTAPPQDYVGQDVAFWMWLALPLTPSSLTSSVFCPRLETVTGSKAMLSLWQRLPSGKVVWASAQGYHFNGWPNWVVLVTGPRVWLRIMTDLANTRATDMGAGITGPYQIKEIQGWGPVCNAIADRFLIKLSGQREAGLPPSGLTEGGSWPTPETLTCENGAVYQLKTSMNGIPLSQMGWTTLPPASSEFEAPSGPSGLLPCSSGSWATPDAALFKACYNVPVGAPCP
jgi:hypothetical protein